MKKLFVLSLLASVIALAGCVTPKGDNVTERQSDVQQMKTETLAELQAKEPAAKDKLARAVGYGVFDKAATAIFVGGTANGYGVIHDKRTGNETYMRAFTGTAGFGFGLKRFRLVILFYDPAVMEHFVTTGWDFGAQASAAAKTSEKGGELATAGTAKRSMDIYEFTEKGLSLRADLKATRFWPDKSMNIE